MAITLETKPGTKPRTNKLETKLGTNLAASAWTQDTATRVPHASITELADEMAYGHSRRPRKKDRGIELGSSLLGLEIVGLF